MVEDGTIFFKENMNKHKKKTKMTESKQNNVHKKSQQIFIAQKFKQIILI